MDIFGVSITRSVGNSGIFDFQFSKTAILTKSVKTEININLRFAIEPLDPLSTNWAPNPERIIMRAIPKLEAQSPPGYTRVSHLTEREELGAGSNALLCA